MGYFDQMIAGLPVTDVPAGQLLIEENKPFGRILVLLEGELLVTRAGIEITHIKTRGAVVGEMSALLRRNATAMVQTVTACRFALIEEPREFLMKHPEVHLHVSEILARRIDAMTGYLVDAQEQLRGAGDHVGMIDEILSVLTHGHPR